MKFLRFASPLMVLGLTSISSPALSFKVNLQAPSTLILNNQNISTGNFVVTSATVFFDDGGNIGINNIIPPINPVIIDATIGSPINNLLFEVPDKTEVLRIGGLFNITDPSFIGPRQANFDMTVGEFAPKIPSSFTAFLPANTNDFAYQITDLGSNSNLNDNSDVFSTIQPVLAMTEAEVQSIPGVTEVIELDNGVNNWFVGYNPSPVTMKPHGTVTATPEPLTILGTVTAIGVGATLKRESLKRRKKKAESKVT